MLERKKKSSCRAWHGACVEFAHDSRPEKGMPASQVATKPLGETVGCGNTAKVDGTTPFGKPLGGTRVMTEPNGNNAKDWAIRRLTAYVRYGSIWQGLRD